MLRERLPFSKRTASLTKRAASSSGTAPLGATCWPPGLGSRPELDSRYRLIDEYDHFTNELLARSSAEFSSVVERGGFVRKFFEVLKEATETVVQRIFMTGVTPVTLDSLTSGFNIASNLTLEPALHDLMGFTHDEVRALLERGSELDDERPAVDLRRARGVVRRVPLRARSRARLFNPDMVLYYLVHRGADGSPPDEMLDTNVASDHRTIERTVRQNEELGSALLNEMAERDTINVKLTRQYSLNRGRHRDDIGSLMFYLGLLTLG